MVVARVTSGIEPPLGNAAVASATTVCGSTSERVHQRRPRPTAKTAISQCREPEPGPETVRPAAPAPATAFLPYRPESVRAARHLVRNKLDEWGLAELVDAAELIVSELATNAAKTGCQRRMGVAVRRITDDTVRIMVRDGSRSLPVMVTAGPTDTSGRGMGLVHRLTQGHWGVTPEALGKTVHADLRIRPAKSRATSETPPDASP